MESNGGNILINIYKNLRHHKKFILLFAIIVTILTGLYVFLVADPIFLSSATLKATSKQSGIGGLLGGGIPDISDLGELAGGGSSSKELALYENILLSRRCVEATIIKFDLNKDWEFKYMQDAVKHFRTEVLQIQKDKLANMMTINVFYKDPVIAKDIVEFLIFQLNGINTELNIQTAKNNKEFIQNRYEVTKKELQQAEDSLKFYQDRYGLLPEALFKAASQAEIQLESEIKSEEIKLELLKKILSPNQSEIITQEEKIKLLNSELDKIKNSGENSSQSNLFLKGAPNIVLNFNRLLRDVEIQNKILSYVIPILEQAKIEEKRETPVVIVLDSPNIPEKKVKPKRATITAISFIVGLFFASVFVTLRTNYKKYLSKIN